MRSWYQVDAYSGSTAFAVDWFKYVQSRLVSGLPLSEGTYEKLRNFAERHFVEVGFEITESEPLLLAESIRRHIMSAGNGGQWRSKYLLELAGLLGMGEPRRIGVIGGHRLAIIDFSCRSCGAPATAEAVVPTWDEKGSREGALLPHQVTSECHCKVVWGDTII